ncbi:glycoside hydrolase family 5 protein [Erythrobacter sp.]|uniref:glycoside hydrolase family 5 protein n=1 Tax=Erythrobacter sp. TaxID=1042 RepID=UPI003264DC87
MASTQHESGVRDRTPVERHGQLSVEGRFVVGAHGEAVSLAGPSFFWSNTGWPGEKYYNAQTVERFAKDWRAGMVRAAIAAENEGSYLTDPKANTERAYAIIDAAIAQGVYVIVDWHSHRAEENVTEATAFFTDIATRYGDKPNVIYEIYNEPLDTTDWETVIKPYAEEIIGVIREIDPDNIIVVGTQSWDQRVDKAADDPIVGQKNLVYALHFYAASHKDYHLKLAQYAVDKGLPLMITEWGSVTYDGDGSVDYESSLVWLAFIRENKLSHAIWAVSDKDEGSAMLRPGASSNGDWSENDLSDSGKFARDVIRNW